MNLEPFCELCKATQQKDQRWAEAFCATLDGVFDDDRFMDMGKVCRLFYGKSRGLSKAQFYRKRERYKCQSRKIVRQGRPRDR